MGRKSVFDYLKRGKFAKAASLLHPGCHQGPNRTALNRYPEVFAAAAPGARRILSFGCSTGEECVTLAEYFPKAEIVGADINPVILLQARKHRSDRIRFVYASDRILSGLGGFDAIFCMAVLRSAGHYPIRDLRRARALPRDPIAARRALGDSQVALPFRRHRAQGLLRDRARRRATRHRLVPSRRRHRSPTAVYFARSSLPGPTNGTKPTTRPTAPALLELSRGLGLILAAPAAASSTAHQPAAWRRKQARRASPNEAPGLHAARPFPTSAGRGRAALAGGSPDSRGLRR